MTKEGKSKLIFLLTALLLLVIAVCSLVLGSVNLSVSRIMAAFEKRDAVAETILFGLRLPRLAAALLAGAGLAVAGMLLQTVTNNELCAPNIIGVNAGAGFFVMLTLCLFPMLWRLLPVTAFIGALLTTLTVLGITRMSGSRSQKTTLVLAGVALSSILNAGIAFLSLKYPDMLSSYTAFSVGGFSGVQMNRLLLPAVFIVILFLFALLTAAKTRLLCLGDEVAASLGVNVKRARTVAVVLASGLCAAVVSFAGLLGFVGLIVPHIVRRICKCGLRAQLCLSAMCGALIAALSDLLGRTVFSPWELPAGIIMAFIGAPFFLYLIVRRKNKYDSM